MIVLYTILGLETLAFLFLGKKYFGIDVLSYVTNYFHFDTLKNFSKKLPKSRKTKKKVVKPVVVPTENSDVEVDITVEVPILLDGESKVIETVRKPDKISEELINRLDFLSERAYWMAFIDKAKLGLTYVIILLLGGMGLWQLVKALFKVIGVYLP